MKYFITNVIMLSLTWLYPYTTHLRYIKLEYLFHVYGHPTVEDVEGQAVKQAGDVHG